MAYRSTPLNPARGAYRNPIAPVWLKVPLLGRDTIELEVIWSVAILRSRVVHALPPVDTPVVETESLCGGKNLNAMIRQSAIAVDAVAAIAISARSPALNSMSPPNVRNEFHRK